MSFSRITGIKILMFLVLLGTFFSFFGSGLSFADGSLKSYLESFEQAKDGMTLWQTIQAGGFVMIVLAGLSISCVTMIIYNFMTLKVSKFSPIEFTENVINKLEEGQLEVVKSLCQQKHNIIASVIMAGIEKKHRGVIFAREAMENCVRKEVNHLWQKISYLADIASIAPLVGLLGTVLGMIQAFNVIAFQSAVVKPMLLAGGISKAMITTAAGLIVAIPAMLFHSYFKGKVLDISNTVETYSTDIMKIMEKV